MDVLYPDSPLADGPTSNAHWRLSIPQDVPDSVAVPLATYRGLLERGLAAESVLARLESEAEMERRQRLDLEELTAAAHRGETPTGTPNMGALPDEIASARAAFRGHYRRSQSLFQARHTQGADGRGRFHDRRRRHGQYLPQGPGL